MASLSLDMELCSTFSLKISKNHAGDGFILASHA